MSDTNQGECRICGDGNDLIEGICQECSEEKSTFERWLKNCAADAVISEQDKELFTAYLRSF